MQGDKRDVFGAERKRWPLWLQIAAGVTLGVLVASLIEWFVVLQYTRYQLQQAAAELSKSAAAASADIRRMNVEAGARDQRSRQAALVVEAERARALAQQQREAEAGRAAAAAEADRREVAWRKFYRPSAGCLAASLSVECANEHIRFKRAFEERYAAGRL